MKYIFKQKTNIVVVTLLDGVGYFLSRLIKPRGFHTGRPPKSFLVIRIDHLGDVLLATGIPKILKENFSDTRLTFLVSSWGAPLLENNPFIDEVIIYDAPWFAKKKYPKSKSSLSWGGIIGLLRKKGIDVGIGLRGDLRENALLWLGGVRERLGYGITGGGFLLTREIPYRRGVHESEHAMDILKAIGIRADVLRPALYFNEREIAEFEKRLHAFSLSPEARYVGFQIGAGSASKEWPTGHFKTFVAKFHERFPGHPLVLVGSGEHAAGEIPQGLGPRCVNLVGKTTLRELCLLMRKFALFIGPDSGPTHLASALGVPALFLFSGTNELDQWRPLEEAATVLKHDVPCSPCGLEICNVPGHPCMSRIEPTTVLDALESVLSSPRRRGPDVVGDSRLRGNDSNP